MAKRKPINVPETYFASEEQKFSHQFEFFVAGKMQMNSNQMDVSFFFYCQTDEFKYFVVLLAGTSSIRLPLLNGSTFFPRADEK